MYIFIPLKTVHFQAVIDRNLEKGVPGGISRGKRHPLRYSSAIVENLSRCLHGTNQQGFHYSDVRRAHSSPVEGARHRNPGCQAAHHSEPPEIAPNGTSYERYRCGADPIRLGVALQTRRRGERYPLAWTHAHDRRIPRRSHTAFQPFQRDISR